MRNTCGLCDQSDQQQRGQSSRDLQLVLWEASVSLVRTAGQHRELILREVKCPILVKLVTKIIVKITLSMAGQKARCERRDIIISVLFVLSHVRHHAGNFVILTLALYWSDRLQVTERLACYWSERSHHFY